MARLAAHAGLRAEVEAAFRLRIPLSQWADWSDDDRGWALAWIEHEAAKCPGCGGWLAETTDPANDDAYVADLPVRCFRCSALHGQQEHYKDHPNRAAQVLWPVRLRRKDRRRG